MNELLGVVGIFAYLFAGLTTLRFENARHAYYGSIKSRCDSDCGSRSWHSERNKNRYCSCGYLRRQLSPAWMIAITLLWPFGFLVDGMVNYVIGGTYEPKEVKRERKEREALEKRQRLEERIIELEKSAGISSK